MLGTQGRTCPECGRTVKSDQQWRRTRRRWKKAIVAVLAAAVIGVGPFWQVLLVRYVEHVPDTVLILLIGRFDDPTSENAVEEELFGRLIESPAWGISRWNRNALSRRQWRMLKARLDAAWGSGMSAQQDVAALFTQAPPTDLSVMHEEMLGLAHDESGLNLARLNQRLQIPNDVFLGGYEKYLNVEWLNMRAVDGSRARIYSLKSSSMCALYAVRQVGQHLEFAGAFSIHSKYTEPVIHVYEHDESIVEIGPISTGGTGVFYEYGAWCRLDGSGLQIAHDWCSGGTMYWGGGPYNYEHSTSAPVIGRDQQGGYVDLAITLTITNAQVSWDDPRCDVEDAAAVAELLDVFARTGMARYRWDATRRRFTLSERESAWTEAQVRGSFYDDALFVTQNFDTLVSFAIGDDPARRSWMRLVLTRLDDCAAKRRLVRKIESRLASDEK